MAGFYFNVTLVNMSFNKLCGRPPQYAPAPCNGSAQRQP